MQLTRHVSQLARLDEMPDETGEGENNTQDRGSDVGPAEEGLFAANPRDSRDDNRLGSTKLLYGVVHVGLNLVGAGNHDILVVASPELAECRKRSDSHPDLEVLVILQLRPLCVAIGVAFSPVGRGKDVLGTFRPLRLVDVAFRDTVPGNVLLGEGIARVGRSV